MTQNHNIPTAIRIQNPINNNVSVTISDQLPKPSANNPNLLSVDTRPTHRKGHHHKHSLSHQYFLPPKNRQPLEIPASYPIPTFKETFAILTFPQKLKLTSSILFFLVAVGVLLSGDATILLTLSCSLIVEGVLIIINVWRETLDSFLVWRHTCLRYPFGMQQMELLVDFSFSILLIFLGMNLLKEPAEHAIEDWGNLHHAGDHEEETVHIHLTISLFASAIISGFALLLDHPSAHIRELNSRFFHGLTLVPSLILVLLLSLGYQVGSFLSHLLSLTIAVTALVNGFSIAKSLALMLLLTYSNKEKVFECVSLIKEDTRIDQLNYAAIWQPHYNTCIANIGLTVSGGEREQAAVREDIIRIIQKTVGSIFGAGVQPKWEISVDIQRA